MVKSKRTRAISAGLEGQARAWRGRKVAVFGFLKRGGKVHTAIIPNARIATPLPIIQENVEPDNFYWLLEECE